MSGLKFTLLKLMLPREVYKKGWNTVEDGDIYLRRIEAVEIAVKIFLDTFV